MSNDDQRFAHMVYFKLNESSKEACDVLIKACQQYLSGHPGTDFFGVGTIADTNRDVVDKGYDVALQLVFKDRASHDAYQVAPLHDQFIAEQKENWAKVRVFDTVLSN